MSKPFGFKHFEIIQKNAPFKVGTDAMILGAWANLQTGNFILDVGSGTGVLALMAAQKNTEADILAIEKDPLAYSYLVKNINHSKYHKRISTALMDIQNLPTNNEAIFNHVICNPPFFLKSTLSPYSIKNTSRHLEDDFLQILFIKASQLLKTDGFLHLIFPFENKDQLIEMANIQKLYIEEILNIIPAANKSPNRCCLRFSKKHMHPIENYLVIEMAPRKYSDDYIKLTKDFYRKDLSLEYS